MSFRRPDSREPIAIGKLRTLQIKLVFVFTGTKIIGSEEEQTEVDRLHASQVDMLRRNEIDVLAHAHIGRPNDEGISALTLEDYKPFARQTWRDGAQAWVLPCTAVRTGGIPEWLEQEFGAPVIMANPATLAHAVELARQHMAVPAGA